jgi:hypothetical protein
MAPPVVKDAEGKVVEEFGNTEKNFFFTKTGRPGYNDTKNQRYTLTIDKNGNITVYSRPKASGLPTVPAAASKIGTYSTDGKFTKTGNTNAGELEYFSNRANYNDVKNHAILVVQKDLSTVTVGDDPPVQIYSLQEREYLSRGVIDPDNFDRDYLASLREAANIEELLDSVTIDPIPTINIEGEGRKEYGNYYYPLALADGSTGQDRIKFTMKVPKGTKVDPFFFKNNKQFERTYESIEGSVTLPIQPVISDRNTVDFAGLQLNAVDAALAGTAMNLINSDSVSKLFDNVGDSIAGVRQTILGNTSNEVQEGLKVFLAQQAAGVQGLLSRTTGAVLNPNLELLFRGPQLRPFSFTFTLSPRNRLESIQTRNIIRFFKQGMSVKTTASNVFLKSPHVFDINYRTFDRNGTERTHPSINLIKTCALVDCGVEYTPDGSYMTFNDEERTMTSYRISLQFTELDPVYDKDYNDQPVENFIGY